MRECSICSKHGRSMADCPHPGHPSKPKAELLNRPDIVYAVDSRVRWHRTTKPAKAGSHRHDTYGTCHVCFDRQSMLDWLNEQLEQPRRVAVAPVANRGG